MADPEPRDVNRTRTQIAFAVIVVGAIGITVISITAIGFAADKAEVARLVFSSVLPLLGTWVGAVLAFYFSRDNLQAASETTLRAVRAAGGLEADTLVTAVMTRLERIRPREEVADEAAAGALKLKNLYNTMKASGYSRVPVLTTQQGNALYVVHEPDIDKYAQERQPVPVLPTALADSDTLAELLKQPDLKSAVQTFAWVHTSATLADARTALGKLPGAKDLFVTDTGQKDGKVVGWLTNSDLARDV